MLQNNELRRYNRHIILPEFGLDKQNKLKEARVLVIGAGGLGCPILLYLTAAGVGNITILDSDVIDESNLQRQVLYSQNDIGKSKAQTAAQKLKEQNPYININAFVTDININNALDYITNHDIIIDGCDNFATRYLLNDACVIANKPLIFGSIYKFEGQVSVFNYNNGPTYRCIYPEPPNPSEVPSCSEIGVIGVLPGIIGTLQATEAIKLICGIGEPLSGKLLIYDALTNFQTILSIEKNVEIKITELLSNYEVFCGIKNSKIPDNDELSPKEFAELLKSKDIFLIDVRETWEYEICHIENAILIPLQTLPKHFEKIPRNKIIGIYCHHGIRSRNALEFLKMNGFKQIFNLSGGIDQWSAEIDSNLERY